VLQPKTIVTPSSGDRWISTVSDFANLLQFSHSVGAIDGKHVIIQAPCGSGSEFYSYKGAFSIVLMAACDAKYCFTMVDIGESADAAFPLKPCMMKP